MFCLKCVSQTWNLTVLLPEFSISICYMFVLQYMYNNRSFVIIVTGLCCIARTWLVITDRVYLDDLVCLAVSCRFFFLSFTLVTYHRVVRWPWVPSGHGSQTTVSLTCTCQHCCFEFEPCTWKVCSTPILIY